jgi:tetratricopeptide (TPR) repeat protein
LSTTLLYKSEIDYELKKGDLVLAEEQYWIVIDDNVELYRENAVRLSIDIPITRYKELESKWEAENYTNERRWIERGIYIYSELLRQEPDRDEYKYNLGRLLFDIAIFHKRNMGTREKAKELFEEVIRLNPTHPKAHLCEYQLGFLSIYEREWRKGINHFNNAFKGKLDYFQQLRAYCNLGICYSQAGEIKKAKECITKAREIDSVENRFTPEIEMASLQIETATSESKPYTLVTKETEKQISEGTAKEIVYDYNGDHYVVLDCRTHKAVFHGPKDSVKLSPRSAELLKFFMTSKQSFTSSEIWKRLYTDNLGHSSVGERSVRTFIMNLRNHIKPCLNEDPKKVILTTGNSYQWNSDYPYKIIVPSQK